MWPHISPKGPATWAVFLAATRGADPGDFDRAVLDALLTESPVGLHVLDTELRLVRFNTASPGMRDVRAEDVIGRPAREVAPTVVTDTVEHLLRHVLSTGEPVIDFVQPGYPPADRQGEHLFSLSAFRLRNRAGEPLGVACHKDGGAGSPEYSPYRARKYAAASGAPSCSRSMARKAASSRPST